MGSHLRKTLIDYLVIAISPALIITLVGSLVFFLIEVFYQGSFHGRLQYIFALFVIGAVLTGRISIEDGRERAVLFAIPLGLVTLVAINRFVEFQGGMLASLSFFINCGLIGLIWWSADRLTWDCTLIDDQEEDSGEGLLETVGLDRPDRTALKREIESVSAEPKFSKVLPSPDQPSVGARRGAGGEGLAELHEDGNPLSCTKSPHPNPLPKGEGTSAKLQAEPEATTSRDERPQSWWEQFVERRHRPHAPGVWVIYFSLAALPLFGIGQIFIPTTSVSSRQYAFQLLFIYTASGLGLLLTTSFLGLRRYLRQRRQEMPLAMVSLWLGIGSVLIVGVMMAAMFLPRPNAEYAVSELPFRIGSPNQKSSRHGVGRDGVKDKQPDKKPSQDQQKPSDDDKSATKPSDDNADKPADRRNEPDRKSPATSEGRPARDKTKTADKSQPSRNSNKSATSGSADGGKKSSDSAPTKPQNDARGSADVPPTRAFPQMPLPSEAPALLLAFFKWILYGGLVLLAVFWLWKNRDAVIAALGNFRQWLADFWHNLFGGTSRQRSEAVEEAAVPKAPQPRFADFTNPFATGTAERYPPEELVRYTFEALEAWARDHGYPRQPEQTPHEFTRRLATNVTSLADDAARLADLYCQVAYAPDTLPPSGVAGLSRLWQHMTEPS